MLITHKCQYALKAVLELSRRYGQGPVKSPVIARKQGVPVRFLEVILNQLKQGRFVEAKRGVSGGYYLARRPEEISVGDIICFVQGPPQVITPSPVDSEESGNGHAEGAFDPIWREIEAGIDTVYRGTTFKDLLDRQVQAMANQASTYII
ncbi:MAG TPA: Rrf2 family transcriptional regulator [Candidatus Brocadiia bacterium]|nr:Rrf2 family transcriptional regulator [Candidatus Brocadiia bacterium]